MTGTTEFKPDWCLAPAAHLREWLDDNLGGERRGVRMLAVIAFGRERRDEGIAAIREVLDRKPLTEAHAAALERGTHVPARMWLALEHNYRAGLAAGLKDVTEDEPEPTP